MRGMAELLKNDSRAAVEAAGHALGAWTPSARIRGYQEASCAHCGHKVVTGPRGMVGQLPPCRRGAHRPDTRTAADPAVRAVVAGRVAKSLLRLAELLAKGRSIRERTIRVYHATGATFADSIKREGLRSNSYKDPNFTLSTDPDNGCGRGITPRDGHAVITFDIPDTDEWVNKGHDMGERGTWYSIKKPIPPAFISKIDVISAPRKLAKPR